MKRIFPLLLAALLMFSLFAGCGNPAPDSGGADPAAKEKLSVISTIFPGYDFARAIAGDNIELAILLPPGSESHSYEPTPQDIVNIEKCDVFICVGGESETWISGILDSIDASDMKIISMMDLVDTVEEELVEGMEGGHDHEEEHAHDHGEEDHTHDHAGDKAEHDEHVWTSPANAMTITRAIADTLCGLDQENAGVYRENAEAYVTALEELDASFREVMQNASRSTVVFGDRFPFRYFAEEYGLEYYAAFPGCSSETEPSAKTVAFLIDKVNEENIPVVFHIELSNEKMADTICEATGAKKLLLHSCHNVTRDELTSGTGYLELMAQNVKALREAVS